MSAALVVLPLLLPLGTGLLAGVLPRRFAPAVSLAGAFALLAAALAGRAGEILRADRPCLGIGQARQVAEMESEPVESRHRRSLPGQHHLLLSGFVSKRFDKVNQVAFPCYGHLSLKKSRLYAIHRR